MTIRNYFIIVYSDSDREKIRLVKVTGYESIDEHDLASRMEFTWYTPENAYERDNSDYSFDKDDEAKNLDEASKYARNLAKEHGLIYESFNNRDGILD